MSERKAFRVYFNEIEPVVILSETKEFYVLKGEAGWGDRRVKKMAWAGKIFSTWAIAHGYLIATREKELEVVSKQFLTSKRQLEATKTMKPPARSDKD